jgi:O-methyltransferase
MSRLENAPSKIGLSRLMAARMDQYCESYGRKPWSRKRRHVMKVHQEAPVDGTRLPSSKNIALISSMPKPNQNGAPTTMDPTGPLLDPLANVVLARMQAQRSRPSDGGPRGNSVTRVDPFAYRDYGFSIHPEQGDLIYLLCRAIRATRVAEFATSIGMSTIYFAAAVRDNGGGYVIGSEIVPEKAEIARRNLAEAGLADVVEIRVGDARSWC